MKKLHFSIISLIVLTSYLFLSAGEAKKDSFKILRAKGNVTIGEKKVKTGEVFDISDIEKLSVSTSDKSGLVIICYNNCAKNKVILERTIKNLDAIQKRKLLETTAFKTRGGALESFPELVNYFEQKPIIILGDNSLAVKQSVLGFPKIGSFLDLYYVNGSEDIVYEIPYQDNSFTFKSNMFVKGAEDDTIVGPITLSMIDPEGSRETLVTEEFYVALINTIEIDKIIEELAYLKVEKKIIAESIYDMLTSQYPNYFIDKSFVQQYVKGK